ncbi:carbohydrate ABC transporter permease [Tessaracoccus oleiagri]|uniref:Multiple sugar transport system permease protein n=1 Tax=Tessaracoccus oleiagri TaxID=686624 RepID=A0A1G9HM30_9ACTN|nr:sugar ABC transporter permease [Tessaracoccus oleiagri]SDL13979.1 multiple sugar transport system permease protein [Tessaracoccus oleiagri]
MSTAVATQPATRKPRSRSGKRNAAEARAGLLLALPFVVLFTVFTLWPVLQSMFMSFTDTRITDIRTPFAVNFVGLDNYAKALGDPVFRRAALNTGIFVVIGVPLTIVAGLAAAVALDKGITKFRSVFRMGFYTPVITSIVAVAVVWRFLLQPDSGLVNTVLGWVGIDGPNWLGDTRTSLLSLIIMAVWRNFGTGMIIFLAGLQAVPWQLHEAAALDGATSWQRFWHITLPVLRPTMLFVMVTTTIGYLQFFEEPFVMTQGGPLNSTLSASMYTYQQFGFGNYGVAGAMAYLTFLVIVIVTIVQFRLTREK